MGNRKNLIKWDPCNIYDTAIIGDDVSVGMFTEIGHKVWIGDNVTIGKGVFIPEGVEIRDNCFIGPHVCFSNDMFPPGHRSQWEDTVVMRGASIGANVSIRPGVIIGEGALVGMGSVVTKNIPSNEIWAGVPAKKIRDKEIKHD